MKDFRSCGSFGPVSWPGNRLIAMAKQEPEPVPVLCDVAGSPRKGSEGGMAKEYGLSLRVRSLHGKTCMYLCT